MAPVPDISSPLRQARLRRGETLNTAARQTRIPKRFLEALEDERFRDFPAPVYLRAFLKDYCDFLELDFQPLWERFQACAVPPPATPQTLQPSQAPETPFSHNLLLSAGVLAFFLSVGLAMCLFPSAPTAKHSPGNIPDALRAAEKNLSILFLEDVWLSLNSEGRLYEGKVPAGSRQVWKTQGEISLRVTNPSALRPSLDGSPLKLVPATAGGIYRIE
jgi:hypothetical protein